MGIEALTNKSIKISDIKDTLKFYAALAIIFGGVFGVTYQMTSDLEIKKILVVGLIVIYVLMVLIAGRNWQSGKGREIEQVLTPLWGKEHLPLDPIHVQACIGVWLCKWSARTSSGLSKAYIDDSVTVESIDIASGEVHASARGVYDKNPTGYKLSGRLSKQGFAQLYYKFPPPHEEKVGMVILRFDYQTEQAIGWWLGGGRGHGTPDTGGVVTWIKADKYDGKWTEQVYEWADE